MCFLGKTTANDSIFTYNTTAGETWYTYNNNSFVPKFYDELLQTTDKEKIDKANKTCQGSDDCIFDILSTNDFSFGAATLQSVNTFAAQNSTMSMYCFFANVIIGTVFHNVVAGDGLLVPIFIYSQWQICSVTLALARLNGVFFCLVNC